MNVRPYTTAVLKEMSKNFEIMIFTASHKSYADQIINFLDPENKCISHRIYKDSCFKNKNGHYSKDLRIINRDLKDVLLVDNSF